MRAALLYGREDLRVEVVDEPTGDGKGAGEGAGEGDGEDEVIVDVEAATTCGTDVKMWRHGHRVLPPYPCRFGHETAGVRADTGGRVLVSDSVACGKCDPCRAGREQICREATWVLGGFAERIAAPPAALHRIPDGLPAAAAAMAEPLAAAVHAVERALAAWSASSNGTSSSSKRSVVPRRGRSPPPPRHRAESSCSSVVVREGPR